MITRIRRRIMWMRKLEELRTEMIINMNNMITLQVCNIITNRNINICVYQLPFIYINVVVSSINII